MRRRPGVLALAFIAGLGVAVDARSAAAQLPDAPVPGAAEALGRLDEGTRAIVQQLIDSARADRLPSGPLMAKVAEGVTKGADGARIVRVVRELMTSMAAARRALGATSADAELVAGAGALQTGADAETLRRLRTAHAAAIRRAGVRAGEPFTLTQPLVVLADLVRRGVSPADAGRALARLLADGATDGDLARLRSAVARDVAGGAAPAAALALRAGQSVVRTPARESGRAHPPDATSLPGTTWP